MRFVQGCDCNMTMIMLQRLNIPIQRRDPSSRPSAALSSHSSTALKRPASDVLQPHERRSASQRRLETRPQLKSSYIPGPAQQPAALHHSTLVVNKSARNELPPPVSSFFHTLKTGSETYVSPYSNTTEAALRTSSALKSSPTVGSGFGSSPAQTNSISASSQRSIFWEEFAGNQSSSIAGINNDNNLDQLLPPKRVLPFAKPTSTSPSRDVLATPQYSSRPDIVSSPATVRTEKPARAQISALRAKAKDLTSAAVTVTYPSSNLLDNTGQTQNTAEDEESDEDLRI